MIRNLIFDWSGTLVDDLTPVLEATNRVFAAHGKPPFDRQAFREKFYLPYEGFYKEHIPHAPLHELEEIFREVFRELHHSVTLLPGPLLGRRWMRCNNPAVQVAESSASQS